MTRKDYSALADAVHEQRAQEYAEDAILAVDGLAHLIADVCAADNPRFNRDRFLIACGVPR